MPHTDPSLPNYEHPTFREVEPWLEFMEDVYDGLEGCKDKYLTRGEKEVESVYKQRVGRAVFHNRLRPTVQSNAGLLTAFEASSLPPSVD